MQNLQIKGNIYELFKQMYLRKGVRICIKSNDKLSETFIHNIENNSTWLKCVKKGLQLGDFQSCELAKRYNIGHII